jgi:hypothetical protein
MVKEMVMVLAMAMAMAMAMVMVMVMVMVVMGCRKCDGRGERVGACVGRVAKPARHKIIN